MGKHDRVLAAIFARPTRANIRWADILSLFEHLGAKISERAGSRVAVLLNDRVGLFHRPHPQPEADKGTVQAVRTFLENAGVQP